MSIYVPDELKGRMDRLNDRVNWSAVAQAAFEIEIRLYPEWKEDRMSAVIERLRASKRQAYSGKIEQGFALGRKWAEENAEYHQLKTLADGAEWDETDADDIEWREIPQTVGQEPEAFWEFVLGDDWRTELDGPLQIGFYKGATAVWSEVEDQI